MNEQETLCYIAGLFDGEGSAGLYRAASPKIGGWQLTVAITMCDREPLNLVAATFGGRVHSQRLRGNQRLIPYTWFLNANRALDVLNTLEPFLIGKRRVVNLIMETFDLLSKASSSQRSDIFENYRLELRWIHPSRKSSGGRPKGSKDKNLRSREGYINRYPKRG